MEKKLFVGGLSYGTTEETLKEAFSQAGTIASVAVITDKFSGRSKGFGFVEMSTEEEAQKAIEIWNGKELDGRTVNVSEARPQGSRPPRTFDRDSRGGGYGGGRSGRDY